MLKYLARYTHRIADSLRFGPALPTFEAKDLRGRTWRTQDLRGKFTVVYIWGTSTARFLDKLDSGARCLFQSVSALPDIQRFYDGTRYRTEIQVLTFCGDHDYTHASEYLKQTRYTFPVIPDWGLIRKLFGGEDSLANRGVDSLVWVINPEGRKSYPFRSWSCGQRERVAADELGGSIGQCVWPGDNGASVYLG